MFPPNSHKILADKVLKAESKKSKEKKWAFQALLWAFLTESKVSDGGVGRGVRGTGLTLRLHIYRLLESQASLSVTDWGP